MNGRPGLLADRLPFYYGWLVLAVVCCVSFARQGPAVATLSIFVEPMTAELGRSRTAISGAVSLGGLPAAVVSPMLGPLVDRHGARSLQAWAVAITGQCCAALASKATRTSAAIQPSDPTATAAGVFATRVCARL